MTIFDASVFDNPDFCKGNKMKIWKVAIEKYKPSGEIYKLASSRCPTFASFN
jgi:hypothetical protein